MNWALTAEHYGMLRKQKIRIGTQDLRIASIVLAVNGTLVTRNQRDFAQVPELTLEDWTGELLSDLPTSLNAIRSKAASLAAAP
jgi:hypothetical protein